MPDSPYTSLEDQASYAIGQQVAEHLRNHPFRNMNFDAVIAGLRDFVEGAPPQVEHETQRKAIDAINETLMAERQASEAAGNEQAKAEGETFLRTNAERPEVTVTESGLQYEVIKAGSGDIPGTAATVRVHYHGTLPDGTVFDSSVERGQPLEFPVNGVIAGWTEALQLMPVGSQWKLAIPWQLAYGERGAGGAIGPYATLVFDVELLAIV